MTAARDVQVLRELELGRILLPQNEAVVFRLIEYERGGVRFDIRRHYTDASGTLRPTAKGLGLKPEHLEDLRKAIAVFEVAEKRGSS